MRHIAIIGSGPAGYYTAEAAQKQWGEDVRVDIFDMLPVPYGLIRTGVAPDHQSIKGVSRRYESTALSEQHPLVGNVTVGEDVSIAELQDLYDAVVLATGAPNDKAAGIPGEGLENVFGSAAFVGWYNQGHPQFAKLGPDLTAKTAVVIGNGNVALDVARILSKTADEFTGSDIVAHALHALQKSHIERIVILGRRGPHPVRERRRTGRTGAPDPRLPARRPGRSAASRRRPVPRTRPAQVGHPPAQLRRNPRGIPLRQAGGDRLRLLRQPRAILGEDRVTGIEVERTALDSEGRASGTGRDLHDRLRTDRHLHGPASHPRRAIRGKRGPLRQQRGADRPGALCVGWARRGPSGTIGTNRPDGFAVVEAIAADLDAGLLGQGGKQGRPGFDRLAEARGWMSSPSATGRRSRRSRKPAPAAAPRARNSSMSRT